MSMDLDRAKEILSSTGCTCVICKEDSVYRSVDRGIAPLLYWLDSGTDMMGYSAADKVVGRGAAFLYCLLGVRRVYGKIMSVGAVKILRASGIEVSWGTLAESIRNRQKNGICPIEAATADYTEPEEALEAIRCALRSIKV